MEYSYPLDLDWSTEEMITVTHFYQMIEKGYESGVKQEALSQAYQEFKQIVPSKAEEKTLFKTLSGSKAKIPEESLRQLGWSEARIKAFQNREKNPNQYYYRFNDPGEPQQTGKWSPKDKALFLKLIREKGVDYQVYSIHYSIHYSGVFSLNRYQVG